VTVGWCSELTPNTEAAGEAHSTHFKDIVPKPYQEFKDVFAKESFDKLPDWKK